MKIDIYISDKNSNKFISVESGFDVKSIQVPDPDYQDISIYKKGLEIIAGEPKIAFDSDKAIEAIKKQSYYLHGVAIKVTES